MISLARHVPVGQGYGRSAALEITFEHYGGYIIGLNGGRMATEGGYISSMVAENLTTALEAPGGK